MEGAEETSMGKKRSLFNVVLRDILILSFAGVAYNIVNFVETHAADADIRGATNEGETNVPGDSLESVVDAGFILTAPLHRVLAENREWVDNLALINSLVLLVVTIYAFYMTLWHGDYRFGFNILVTQLFRSFCGFFTYLPPPKDFLMSLYDFPEVVQCLHQDCSAVLEHQQAVLPFVTFFSGHVATCLIAANHMYVHGYFKSSAALHALNVFQIIRLLATRGHYSIDIIIGWCVAVYMSKRQVTREASRERRMSYSRSQSFTELVSSTATDAFETVTGVHQEDRHDGVVQSDTTARIAAEAASNFAKRSLSELQDEATVVGLQLNEIKELRRNDLLRLVQVTKMKLEDLRSEGRLLDVKLTEGITRGEMVFMVRKRVKQAIESVSGHSKQEQATQ